WSPQAAWDEMLRAGFHVRWSLVGFTSYFWSHTRKPPWVLAVRNDPRWLEQPPVSASWTHR
ncbi:MAG: hypothetical protein ACREP9_17540, partial [Candidatus Dormibacteraceae bacterium]